MTTTITDAELGDMHRRLERLERFYAEVAAAAGIELDPEVSADDLHGRVDRLEVALEALDQWMDDNPDEVEAIRARVAS